MLLRGALGRGGREASCFEGRTLYSSIVFKGQVTFSVNYGNPGRGHCTEVLFGEWMEGQPHSAVSLRW